jgi:hypothetical protein
MESSVAASVAEKPQDRTIGTICEVMTIDPVTEAAKASVSAQKRGERSSWAMVTAPTAAGSWAPCASAAVDAPLDSGGRSTMKRLAITLTADRAASIA